MTLYHFCAAHMRPSIMRDGLTLGGYPLVSTAGTGMIQGVQWLTTEPDPRKQSWATHNLVSYNRTDYRLTVRVPDSYHKKLVKATEYIEHIPEEYRHIVTDWPGSGAEFTDPEKGCGEWEEERNAKD